MELIEEIIENNSWDYKRIEKAIDYIRTNFKSQPDLDELAEKVHLSPFHFQRLFTNWAGISPKQFLGFLTLNYAKSLIHQHQSSLFDTSLYSGLSGPSRLHDLFIKIESMSPGVYKSGGKDLIIHYSFGKTLFGEVIMASTEIGLSYISFMDEEEDGLNNLTIKFPKAKILKGKTEFMESALKILNGNWDNMKDLKLHLKGTPFQIKVWEALLKIPMSSLKTYSDLAEMAGTPKAQRAVGSAIGDNPIAYLIPCHRVIRNTGELGGYHWGLNRKAAIIGWEAANRKS